MISKLLRNFIVLMFIIPMNPVSSQDSEYIDSLINSLESVNNYDSATYILNEADSISHEINYPVGVFWSNFYLANLFQDFPYERTKVYLRKADSLLDINSNLMPDSVMISYYLVKGNVLGLKGSFDGELKNYLLADSLTQIPGLEHFSLFVDQHIANYQIANKNYEEALRLCKKNLFECDFDGYSYANIMSNVGIVFKHLEQYDSCIFYIKESIDLNLGDYINLYYQYLTIADAYLFLNELDSAEKYLVVADQNNIEGTEYSVDDVFKNNIYGDLYLKRKEYKKANEFYERAIVYSDSLNFYNGLVSTYSKLISASFKSRADQRSLEYFKKYKEINDSIHKRATLKLEKEYLFQKELISKEATIKELKLINKNASKIRLLILSVLIAIVLLFLFLINRYKNRQVILKQNLAIETLEKDRVRQDLSNKEKELQLKIDTLNERNKIIEKLKKNSNSEKDMSNIFEALNQNYINDTQWNSIILQFGSIHSNFVENLTEINSHITQNDIRLFILIKLKYSNSGMSEILNISVDGVKKAKQRLKKKIGDIDLIIL